MPDETNPAATGAAPAPATSAAAGTAGNSPGVGTQVASESDARTANNAVRHTYRILSDAEKATMIELKDMGAAFIAKCSAIGKSRELSLAVTKAEEAVMWAVKHVTA